MKIKKKYQFIKIKIKDPSKYTDVALLVDNLDFIAEVESARKKYKGLNFVYPLSDNDRIKAERFQYQMLYTNKVLGNRFKADTEYIRRLFRRPPHFRDVIEASIIYGEVVENDYSKAYLEEQEITPIRTPNDIPDIKYCIVIHSGTRPDDVNKVFDKFKKEVKINFRSSNRKKRSYKFGYWLNLGLAKTTGTMGSIKSLRKLYQRWLQGETPIMIALSGLHISKSEYKGALRKTPKHSKYLSVSEEESDKCEKMVKNVNWKRDDVKSLINRYRDLLYSSNTLL